MKALAVFASVEEALAKAQTGGGIGGGRWIVAVSGGLDSVVLLRVLAELRPQHGGELVIAHFNHQLRDAESEEDQRSVERLGQELGLPVEVGSTDVRGQLGKGDSLEAVARRCRHEFLAAVARRQAATCVATAHHADDQVELLLMRLVRGAGAGGLGGMPLVARSPVDAGVTLVRPLLNVTREELRALALARGWAWREDVSNTDPARLRNRVRHRLLPWLRAEFGTGIETVLRRNQSLLREQGEALDGVARAWLKSGPREAFESLTVGLQREVLRVQFESAGVAPNFDWIEALRRSVETPVMIEPARQLIRASDGRVRVESAGSGPGGFRAGETWVDLTALDGVVEFGGGRLRWRWWVKSGAEALEGERGPTVGPGEECLDGARVGGRCRLRHWRAGDRFAPLGLGNAAKPKLQDLFTNAGVPVRERRERVLAETADGEIFWVEGLRLGEAAKRTEATARFLRWCWQRP